MIFKRKDPKEMSRAALEQELSDMRRMYETELKRRHASDQKLDAIRNAFVDLLEGDFLRDHEGE